LSKLFVTFAFPIEDAAAFEVVDTNMKRAYITDIIEAYLQDIMGTGKDPNEARDLEVYEITLTIDLSDDYIEMDSNCGNMGLVAGILVDILWRLHEEK
jgi:hypothetical protein